MIYLIDQSMKFQELASEIALESLTADNLKHLKALRPDVGEEVAFMNLQGKAAVYKVREIRPFVLAFDKIIEVSAPEIKTHLFLAPPSDSALEQAVEQATEVGYDEIHFVRSEHVQVPKGKTLPFARLKRIIHSSCKQCARLWEPVLHEELISFEELLATSSQFISVCADEASAQVKWGSLEGNLVASKKDLAVWVGPEGGWSHKEREALRGSMKTFSLGPNVLRVPTAVVSAYVLCWKELSHG